jgi:hypothetical protein
MAWGDPPTPLQINYIDPDGNNWNLSDTSMAGGYVCAGIAGIEGLVLSMSTIPMLDGTAIPNFYIPQPGSIAMAVLIARPETTGDEDDYYNLLDRFVRAFFNRRNELPKAAYLQIQRPDGSTRQLQVYTTAGLNTPEVALSNHSLYSVTLVTPDPYWTDLVSQSLIYKTNIAAGILPLLPIPLGSGTVLGNATLTNQGSALTWPTWTITGPGTPTLKNLLTNKQWSLNTAIPTGNVVQVTTKPGTQMAVNLTTQTNIWDQLVLGTSIRNLWPLMAGDNPISIVMAGATAATSVQVDWTNRWNRA